ncbi:MAG: hypothetical protein WC608_03030 [Parcubacteria group bacterium]
MSGIKTEEMEETFRKLVSEKLGIDFISRNSSPCFLISIKAYPNRAVSNDELLRCLDSCFKTTEFEPDLTSMKSDDDLISIKMERGDEKFIVGIVNATEPAPRIMITVLRM